MEKLFEEREILSFDAQDNRIKRMSSVEAPETDDDSEDLIDE
jgi:hypothetical protein